MTFASIHVEDFRSLVQQVEWADTAIYETFGNLNDHLVELDCPVPSSRDYTAQAQWLSDEVLPDLKRRLALAEAMQTGTSGLTVVEIDESLLPTSTPDEAAEDAAEVAQLMEEVGQSTDHSPFDDRITDLLTANANDPYFAAALAEHLSPEQLSHYVLALSGDYHYRGLSEADAETYEAQLSALGSTLGLASRGTGDTGLPSGYVDDWMRLLDPDNTDRAAPVPAALSLVVSRGAFSTDFLTRAFDTVAEIEIEHGQDVWDTQAPIIAPGGHAFNDPVAGITAGLAFNPEAAQTIFDPSRTGGPEFGEEGANGDALRFVFSRPWQYDDGTSLAAALQVASVPYEGGSTVSLDIANEIAEVQQELEDARNAGFWSGLGHFLLDLVGLVPGLGEWADGLNAGWYTAEGNYVDASLSAAGAVPVAGWVAIGGKWVRKVGNLGDLGREMGLSADEIRHIEDLLRNADSTELGEEVGRTIDFGGERLFFREGQVQHIHFFRGTAFGAERQAEIVNAGGFAEVLVPRYKLDADGLPVKDADGNFVLDRGANGQVVYNRVDGYVPGGEIIEIKSIQLGDRRQGLDALRQLHGQYGPGTPVPNVPTTRDSGLAGSTLDGQMVLEVPPQNGPIHPDILEYADTHDIVIRTTNGEVLN